jgi:hypothetical protein
MALKRAADNRRRTLLQALAGGLLAAAHPAVRSQVLGKVPRELPPGQSIYDLHGPVSVNGLNAVPKTFISPNDTISTGKNGRIIFVVGKDAFLLRENSTLSLAGSNMLVQTLRLATGALLSVFGKEAHELEVSTGTIGIRGTGVYAEAQPEQSYVCTCYGITELRAAGTSQRERIESKHHDAPRYIVGSGSDRIRPAPVINHTDEEVMLIEALVGRTPPFALFDDTYGRSRRY